ncbi:EAL domain-containing protein [Evansella sp. AB-P1]|uniref:sensor domain-containing protein n=1 Tax=Evansella sp. AB-P1 TaxID=3037653 RepID=UPI00241E71B6|nr:EAL domain-containing protein [Evansella sp. AB-P1]MDG5787282.1 EAL domain-containing protein [Evansella sp. AB-P1]
MFYQTNDGLIVTNSNREIIFANPAFEKMTGYTMEELHLRNPNYLSSGNTEKHIYEEMWSNIKDHGSWSGELVNRKKNGELIYSYTTITQINENKEHDSFYIGAVRDMTDQREAEQKLDYLAHYDLLTNLPNRTKFKEILTTKLKDAEHHNRFALLFLDLDRFKLINDTLGHHAGDILLKDFGNRLRYIFGEKNIVSRFGGDEFLILLEDGSTEKKVIQYIEQFFRYQRENPIFIEKREYYITASVGISFYPDHGIHSDILIQNADTAMYSSKDEGKNNFHFFHDSIKENAFKQLVLGNHLRLALEKCQFDVHYQLMVNTNTMKPYGLEALIRWNHPVKGVLGPNEFLHEAEELGLIVEMDYFVMKKAIEQLKQWNEKGYNDMVISINVSKKQFDDAEFASRVIHIINNTGINPHQVSLEITENYALNDVDDALEKLIALKNKGVRIALDDFGIGYSSLSQLIQFPIDTVKIDKAFLKNIEGEELGKDVALVKAIVQMAKQLGFSVICEGVEKESQLLFVKEQGSDIAQGYFFNKPLPAREVEQLFDICNECPV